MRSASGSEDIIKVRTSSPLTRANIVPSGGRQIIIKKRKKQEIPLQLSTSSIATDGYHGWLLANKAMWEEVFLEQCIEDRSIREAVELLKNHSVWGGDSYSNGRDVLHISKVQAVINLIE